MATAKQIIAKAKSQIGVKESPKNSNRQKYGKAYGMNGVPWCMIFVWWVFRECGASKLITKTASCPTLGDWAIAHDLRKSIGRPGDIVLFDFNRNRSSDHVGIVEKVNSDGTYTCIEGNTSVSNNSNGGQVMRRKRYPSQINFFVRPKYSAETSTSKHTTVKKKTYSGSFPTIPKRGYFAKGDKGAQVKKLQRLLNWATGSKLSIDGEIGNKTLDVILDFQKSNKLTADKKFGQKCLMKAKKIKK